MTESAPKPSLWTRLMGNIDPQFAFVVVYTIAILTWIEYRWLSSRVYQRIVTAEPARRLDPDLGLDASVTWALATIALFLVLPALLQLGLHRESLAKIGWRSRGVFRHLAIYMGLYLVMAPLIWMAAARPDFLASYPFVPSASTNLDHFLIWEGVYILQFIALESFFRGYLLFRLEKHIGDASILVMTIPYAMIHWHKPELEAYGAIFAGLVLGRLALRFRSWYGGALLHILVAVTMDVIAVRRAGLF